MNASINKVILVGNLGSAPKVHTFPDGSKKATLRLATTDRFRDRAGNMQEETQWHTVRLAGRSAEVAAEYLKKGDSVYIEGSLGYRKWTGDDQVERTVCEIFADEMRMLGSRGKGSPEPEASAPAASQPAPSMAPGIDDDIPF